MVYVIIGESFTFPEGDAATNRVYAYAKGFLEHGIKPYVICLRNDYLTIHSGDAGGIRFYHPFNQTVRNSNFFVRRYQKARKYHNTISLLKQTLRNDRVGQLTVYSTRLFTHIFAWYLSHRFDIKLLKECSEHPLRLYRKNFLTRGLGNLKFKTESLLCDGIICISRFLIDFHINKGIKEQKLLLIPSTVDPERFAGLEVKPLTYRYIGYFGALTFRRDNVDVLIKAFALISEKYPDYYLVIGGPGTESDRKGILALAKELNVFGKINLLDYMPREEIAKYISGSDILVMVRSQDMESQASFPSKLTEYLAASRPLITVNVGEISEYLEDGINAFIVKPGDATELSKKLGYVIDNYDFATSVAREGHKLTHSVFNYKYQAGRIIALLDNL